MLVLVVSQLHTSKTQVGCFFQGGLLIPQSSAHSLQTKPFQVDPRSTVAFPFLLDWFSTVWVGPLGSAFLQICNRTPNGGCFPCGIPRYLGPNPHSSRLRALLGSCQRHVRSASEAHRGEAQRGAALGHSAEHDLRGQRTLRGWGAPCGKCF